MANYVFFVSANPRALILIASTFTGIKISHQISLLCYLGWHENFGPLENWFFAENFCPRADQYSMKKILIRGTKIPWKIGPKLKILLKTRAGLPWIWISMDISMDGYRDFGHIHGYCGYQKLNFQGYRTAIISFRYNSGTSSVRQK